MIRGLHHVQLAMPEGREAAARFFYGDILGLPEWPKPAVLAARGGCWFEEGAVRVHMGVDPDFRPARKAHPALLVDDLGGLCARLTEAGYHVIADDLSGGHARAYVDDPFGNRIELVQFPG